MNKFLKNGLLLFMVLGVSRQANAAELDAQTLKKKLMEAIKNRNDFEKAKKLAAKRPMSHKEEDELVGYFRDDYFTQDFELACITGWFEIIEAAEEQAEEKTTY